MENKIICIDLDGTIAHYEKWEGETHFGDPVKGVSQALAKLKENAWILIIYTTRRDKELIKGFLTKNKIPYDYINENPFQPDNAGGGKLYADIYIDDKALQFNGNWEEVVDKVLNFKPWMELANNEERKNLAREFLHNDFTQSYEQLRHYDNLSWDITKFSFIELLAGISAVWVIYSFALKPENSSSWIHSNYTLLIPSIFGLCYVFSLLASFLISRNRVYFSKVAKYLNEHRKFSLSIRPLGFENETKFYTNTKFPPAFDIWSTHLVSLYVIQLVSSLMFGCMIFCLLLRCGAGGILIFIISILMGILSLILNITIYVRYMMRQDNKLGN